MSSDRGRPYLRRLKAMVPRVKPLLRHLRDPYAQGDAIERKEVNV